MYYTDIAVPNDQCDMNVPYVCVFCSIPPIFLLSMITSVYKTLCSINMHNMNVLMYVYVYDIY